MATIITVHGTGATGPEEGQAWWQKGSAFEKHIGELVEGEDGKLEFQRLIWDGANSEKSRRIAARELLAEMRLLEGRNSNYCLIAHSHGGSVASSALLLGAEKKDTFPRLQRWITIGTPFVRARRTKFLFSRLGLVGKSAYISVIMMLSIFGFIIAFGDKLPRDRMEAWFATFCTILFPIFVLYIVVRWLNSQRLYMYHSRRQERASKHFSRRWLPLFHNDDEAIQGLRSLQKVRVQLFPPDFAVSSLSFASLFVMPLLLVFFAMPSVTSFVNPYVELLVSDLHSFITDWKLIGIVAHYLLNSGNWKLVHEWLNIFWLMVVLPMSLLFVSLSLFYFSRFVATLVSYALSIGLNHMTGRQIRRLAFGADTEGEMPVEAQLSPPWIHLSPNPLPAELSKEISRLSNEAVAQSVAKFRSTLDRIALRDSEDVKERLLAEYLTWEELIHCCYFSVPHFRMLVAYAIAQSEGFRPSAAFQSHPDYQLVARWYGETKPKQIAPITASNERGSRAVDASVPQVVT